MKLHTIPLFIIYTLLIGLMFPLKAEEPPAEIGQQLLLLRNGQTLEGQISRSGEIYRVVLSDGEIRIKAADVELVCKDLEEGYQRKRAAIPSGNLREHLDLAQWCQRHKLFDHAAAELAAAAAIAPQNPMVPYLQRRLQSAVETPPERPKNDTSRDQSLSNEELDRMVRGLPHKAVEIFTQSVQPLLMNNCTSSGCHGPQSKTGLRLQRIPADEPAGRRLTQRNIYSVLQYVDRSNPLASKILTVPTAPHGSAKSPVFSEHQAMQYKRLVDWVAQLGPNAMPEPPPAILNNDAMLANTFPEAESTATVPRVLPQDARKGRPMPQPVNPGATAGLPGSASGGTSVSPVQSAGATTNLRSVPGLPGSAQSLNSSKISKHQAVQATFQEPASKSVDPDPSIVSESQRPKIKRGASQREFTPKDSFDPEIFNRRYIKPTPPADENN